MRIIGTFWKHYMQALKKWIIGRKKKRISHLGLNSNQPASCPLCYGWLAPAKFPLPRWKLCRGTRDSCYMQTMWEQFLLWINENIIFSVTTQTASKLWPMRIWYKQQKIRHSQEQIKGSIELELVHVYTSTFYFFISTCIYKLASFPGLPRFLFFGLRSVHTCNTRKRKSAKNGEGLVSCITCVTSGGRGWT